MSIKDVGYQHDLSQVNLDHLAEEVPVTFLFHRAWTFLLCGLHCLEGSHSSQSTLRSRELASSMKGKLLCELFGILFGIYMSSHLFYHPLMMMMLHIFSTFLLFSTVKYLKLTLCVSFLSPYKAILLRSPVLENSIRS